MRLFILSTTVLLQCSIMPRFFNWEARNADSQPDAILAALRIQPGWTVADIGSGGGYFSFRFAEATGPSGTVLAVDVNKDYLEYVAAEAKKRGLGWVRTVQAHPESSGLNEASIDLAFCRNVYHHLPDDRIAYFRGLKSALKKDGRLAIIDYKKSGRGFAIWTGHHTDPEQIKSDLNQAGFTLVAEHTFLEEQSFLEFKPTGL